VSQILQKAVPPPGRSSEQEGESIGRPEVDVVVDRVAGLDISKADVKVCVRVPAEARGRARYREQTRTFTTMTADLLRLGDWLAACAVELVAMEATGDYWKPVFYLLEERFTVWLVNARDVKKVPGRKTDVKDAQWLAQLAAHGLVAPSFVPPPPIRRLRDLTRARANLTRERARALNRLETVLEDAGIKVSAVLSRTLTMSGRRMLEALIAGERNPTALADLALGKARPKIAVLRAALAGRFTDHHAFLAGQALRHLDWLDTEIATLDARIDAETGPLAPQRALLESIPGVGERLSAVILAETGGDMTQFPTPAALASWAGVAPGNNESAGKNLSGATTHGDTWLLGALGDAAAAAARTKQTYLGVYYKRIARRRGTRRALVAVMHKIVIAVWHMLTHQRPYHDLGPDYFHNRPGQLERRRQRLLHELADIEAGLATAG
jgi:transposase